MLLRENTIKWWFVIQPLLTNVSALPGETWTPEIASFQSYCIPCLENDTALACYIFNTHHLSICRPLSPLARRRTAQCSPVLRQQRTPSATRRTLADNAAGVQERLQLIYLIIVVWRILRVQPIFLDIATHSSSACVRYLRRYRLQQTAPSKVASSAEQ